MTPASTVECLRRALSEIENPSLLLLLSLHIPSYFHHLPPAGALQDPCTKPREFPLKKKRNKSITRHRSPIENLERAAVANAKHQGRRPKAITHECLGDLDPAPSLSTPPLPSSDKPFPEHETPSSPSTKLLRAYGPFRRTHRGLLVHPALFHHFPHATVVFPPVFLVETGCLDAAGGRGYEDQVDIPKVNSKPHKRKKKRNDTWSGKAERQNAR